MRQVLKAAICCVLFGLAVLAVNNCSPKSDGDGLKVYFETMPNLQDNQVFYKGEMVGTIQFSLTGGFRVAKLVVALKDEFLRENGDNLAFFVRYGRLEAVKLSSLWRPLDKDSLLCGFNSSMELNWFKIKTLFGDRIAAAEKRARSLDQRFSADAGS